jgi:hypothetical protein
MIPKKVMKMLKFNSTRVAQFAGILLIMLTQTAGAHAAQLTKEQESSLKIAAAQAKDAVLNRNSDQLLNLINPEGIVSASGDEEIPFSAIEKDIKGTKGVIYCGIWGGCPRKNLSVYEKFKKHESQGFSVRVEPESEQPNSSTISAVVKYLPKGVEKKKGVQILKSEWIWRADRGWKMLGLFN